MPSACTTDGRRHGFDGPDPLEWIRYVKMTDPDNKQGDICGLVDVAAYSKHRVGGVVRVWNGGGQGTYASGEW